MAVQLKDKALSGKHQRPAPSLSQAQHLPCQPPGPASHACPFPGAVQRPSPAPTSWNEQDTRTRHDRQSEGKSARPRFWYDEHGRSAGRCGWQYAACPVRKRGIGKCRVQVGLVLLGGRAGMAGCCVRGWTMGNRGISAVLARLPVHPVVQKRGGKPAVRADADLQQALWLRGPRLFRSV